MYLLKKIDIHSRKKKKTSVLSYLNSNNFISNLALEKTCKNVPHLVCTTQFSSTILQRIKLFRQQKERPNKQPRILNKYYSCGKRVAEIKGGRTS